MNNTKEFTVYTLESASEGSRPLLEQAIKDYQIMR